MKVSILCCRIVEDGGPWCTISRTPSFELAFSL
jgi:hypothetical protein